MDNLDEILDECVKIFFDNASIYFEKTDVDVKYNVVANDISMYD